MVLPIIAEEPRFKSMSRCPRFEKCLSALCPLDPFLKHKVSLPGRPLCFWYELAQEIANFADMPPFVVNKLPIYIVHLLKLGVLDQDGATVSR